MSRNLPSDQALVARVRAGSDEAYETIVRRYAGPLTGFATKLLSSSQADAEDVVQEAFIRALPGLRRSDRDIALRPWLYMIVRNRAYDHSRAAHRHPTDSADKLALVPDAGADPADRAAAREELAAIVAEIGRLPERQRLALVRRELGGASHTQLAEELETTVPAVKSLLVRSRSTLAEAVAA